MANPEHLEILKQGVEVWNEWRRKSSDIKPDLSGASLPLRNLNSVNLNRADLSGSNLRSINLSCTDLSYANLCLSDLRDAQLFDADIRRAFFNSANLRRANFNRANLCEAHLFGADLSQLQLRGAKLRDTVFNGANLSHANFCDADLTSASLGGAYLEGAQFRGAVFTDAHMAYTKFADNDLSEIKGLETVNHHAPSFLSIDTIYKSHGNVSEVFLRGCGVPDEFITYMHSLTWKGLDFYKCFISFTEADDAFSERLYNDLQAEGVRCWRWKEDAKWGKALMRSIDEAVRIYDKLIVICSEKSLNSPAVIREIERALQKEDDLARQGKEAEVLFPIRLDDYIFTGWNHHRKADVIAKNVGDFSHWNEPEQYKKAFDKLLRDLKAEES